ncbi:MAG: O-antigen ligase family protein [Pseudonocardiales bacterium]
MSSIAISSTQVTAGFRMPAVLVLGLFGVALMGQFTLDRLDIEQFGELDLRLVAFPALVAAVGLWRFQPGHRDYRHVWPPASLWAIATVGYLALTAFWAPYEARISETLTDLVFLGLLIVVATVVSAPDPARARRLTLAAMYIVAVVYALAGVLIGETDAQGRTTAFAGGPNVYTRVILLGVVAAIALTALYGQRLFLVAIPLLASAALLPASRGAIVAALATVVLFGALTWGRWSFRAVGLAVLVTAGTLIVTWNLLPSSAVAVVRYRFVDQVFERNELSGRPELISQALTIFVDDPLIGAGLDSYFVRFGLGAGLEYPHNLVLDLAATGGVAALAIFGMFVVALVRDCRPVRRMTADQLAMLLSACYLGAASMFSGEFYDSRFFWVFAVLAVNYPAVRYRSSKEAPRSRLARRPPLPSHTGTVAMGERS